MDKVWGANVSQVPPSIPADAPIGYPTDGSSTGGVSATVPKAFWYYMLAEEITNAIKGGGLNLDRNDLSQLNKSIDTRINKAVETINQAISEVVDKVQQVETTPPGAIMAFARSTPPSSYWLVCDGRAVSRSTYSNLFSAIGTTFGAGNGSTTFNLPDLRGVFVRGWDTGRGFDNGRAFGSFQGDAIRNITGSFGADDRMTYEGMGGAFYHTGWHNTGSQGSDGGVIIHFDASRVVPVASDNRPRNIALLHCIHI